MIPSLRGSFKPMRNVVNSRKHLCSLAVLLAVGFIAAERALAHSGTGQADSFLSGFLHPIMGLDHVVAMVAVGIWGAVLGNPALWILPLAFPIMMTVGGAVGIAGFDVPYVEAVIALSGVVLGALVLFYVRAPLVAAALIVSVFAVFHGYAHGKELPSAASPVGYSVGFVTGTGLLHLVGIGLGALDRLTLGKNIIRALGAVIAGAGLYFLLA